MSKILWRIIFTLSVIGFSTHSIPVLAQGLPLGYDTGTPSNGPRVFAQEMNASPAGTYDTAPIALTGRPSFLAPIGLKALHYCYPTYYLQSAMEDGKEGSVEVDFKIGIDGHTENAVVMRSSGWRDIDQVAIECVAKWKYQPATKNGAPVEASSKARITVQINTGKDTRLADTKITGPTPKRMTQCSVQGSNKNLKPPVVAMTVDTMGDVRDPAIEQSSGDPEVDKVVLECVKKWKFTPAAQMERPLVVRIHGTIQMSQNAAP